MKCDACTEKIDTTKEYVVFVKKIGYKILERIYYHSEECTK